MSITRKCRSKREEGRDCIMHSLRAKGHKRQNELLHKRRSEIYRRASEAMFRMPKRGRQEHCKHKRHTVFVWGECCCVLLG